MESGVQLLDRRRMRDGRQIIGPRKLPQPFDLALSLSLAFVVALPRTSEAIAEQKMADKFGEGLRAPTLAVAEDFRHGDLAGCLRDLTGSSGFGGGWVAATSTRSAVEAHVPGQADHAHAVWTLVMFEAWRER